MDYKGYKEKYENNIRCKIKIYQMDCNELLKQTPDKYYSLCIVDPPYRNQSENQPTKDMRNNGSISNFGDKPDSLFFEELFRVSKNQIIWGANNFSMPFKGFVVWKKTTISDKFTMSMCEIASLSEGIGTTSKHFELQPQDPYRIHPTQKPVALYKWLLQNYAKKGDKILDTHLGSMSSVIACYDEKFDITGSELDPDYFKAGMERVKKHTSQVRLDDII